jgi:hypothetical protein
MLRGEEADTDCSKPLTEAESPPEREPDCDCAELLLLLVLADALESDCAVITVVKEDDCSAEVSSKSSRARTRS